MRLNGEGDRILALDKGNFEREVTAEQIARVRERAEDTRRRLAPVGAVT
jgi:hypothetical protein